LTDLQALAEAGGWQPLLERELGLVRTGDSVVAALGRLGVDQAAVAPDTRGGFATAGGGVWDPARLDFEYVCPSGVCPRRSSRDLLGRTPLCRLDEIPMKPRAAGSA
jgi:hypothetical protein